MARMRRVEPTIQLIFARLAECSGEKDAEHVHNDRPDEDVRRPVVHLAHEQAAANREAQVQRRGERLGDGLSAERGIRALVDDVLAGGDEVEGQENACPEEHDERVEGDLANQERPVVREDLVEQLASGAGDPESFVEPVEKRVNHCPRSQYPGPTGSS